MKVIFDYLLKEFARSYMTLLFLVKNASNTYGHGVNSQQLHTLITLIVLLNKCYFFPK